MAEDKQAPRWIIWTVFILALFAPFVAYLFSIHQLHGNAPLAGAGVSISENFFIYIWEVIRSQKRRRSLKARINFAPTGEVGENEAAKVSTSLSAEDLRLKEYRTKRDEAEAELGRYLPANPRGAKRLINHERLYGQIAEDRHIFGGEPELTHRHLVKWVLIVEHWPRLAAALTLCPDEIRTLEDCADIQSLQEKLNSFDVNIRATSELLEVLSKAVPLSPILGRLVRFEPSVTSFQGTTTLHTSEPAAMRADPTGRSTTLEA